MTTSIDINFFNTLFLSILRFYIQIEGSASFTILTHEAANFCKNCAIEYCVWQ
jgi:hypothetical protein